MLRVHALWRYPVKSLRGEACETVTLEERGVVGDRLYAIRDTDGKFGSGKSTRRFRRIDRLFELASEYEDDVPVVRFPDGGTMRGDDPNIHEALSGFLGQTVTLAREEAILHFDAGPVHIITTSALAWLQNRLPDRQIDPRRFRPNIVIDDVRDPTPDDEWLGQAVAIGAARLRILDPTERCVMVNSAQAELAQAPDVLRTITQEADLLFGLYAEVVVPGEIKRGDLAALCDDWREFSSIL